MPGKVDGGVRENGTVGLLGFGQAELRGLACGDADLLACGDADLDWVWHALVRLPTVEAGEGVGVLARAGAAPDGEGRGRGGVGYSDIKWFCV